jgi:hypothetical protein
MQISLLAIRCKLCDMSGDPRSMTQTHRTLLEGTRVSRPTHLAAASTVSSHNAQLRINLLFDHTHCVKQSCRIA